MCNVKCEEVMFLLMVLESECLWVNKNICEEPSKKRKKDSRLACTGLQFYFFNKDPKMHLSSLAHD